MGEIYTDTRVRVHGNGQLPGAARLPSLDGVRPRPEPVLDRVGRLVGEYPLLLAGGAVAGALAGATAGSGSLLLRGIKGMGGAIAGLLGAAAIGTVVGRAAGTSDPATGAFVAASGAAPEPRPAGDGGPERLRVVDWNVHALMGRHDGPRSNEEALADIAAVVARERPDVLMLQEVQVDSLLGGAGDDLRDLAEALGATDAVLVPNGTRPNGTQKGQAILTFGETRVQEARGLAHADPLGSGLGRQLAGAVGWARTAGIPLPDIGPAFHPRTTADAMLTTPAGRAVRLLDVHLSGTGGAATGGTPGRTQSQRDQLLPLIDTLDAWHGPTLLGGDFNVHSGTPTGDFEAAQLGRAGLRDAFTQRGHATDDRAARGSFQGGAGDLPIDRIYTSEEFTVRDVRVLRDDTARAASDHLPIVADLELR